MKKQNRTNGFTIAEVMIVLTIVGLIILMVFSAIFFVQRSARNTKYRRYTGIAAAQMEEYKKLEGHYPMDQTQYCDFILEYMAVSGITPVRVNDASANCVSANLGPVDICFHENLSSHAYRGPSGEISLQFGHWCNRPLDPTTDPIVSTGSEYDNTKYVIWTVLEPDNTICVDNSPVIN